MAVVVFAAGAALGATTSRAGASAGRLAVAANFYPVQEAAEAAGGKWVSVTNLTPVAGEPHDLELTPSSLKKLEDAQVVFFMGRGFQPSVEKAVKQLPKSVARVDLLRSVRLLPVQPALAGTKGQVDGEELEGGVDPHVWVDPHRFEEIATKIATTLERVDPKHADDYQANLATYVDRLDQLDHDFQTGLADCESRTIVTSHRAFEYFSERYHLHQIAISGISPDEEPDPQSLKAVADAAKRENVKVIYFESLVPKKLSETVANEIGATTDSLNPVEGLTADEVRDRLSYDQIQRQNLAALEKGLRCAS
jgi:zinc transport system substrate-binding protein